MKAGFETVIGLEVHVQLLTRSKMFCACPNRYRGEPKRTCPVCLGLPGTLRVLNGEAVRMAIALGLALEGRIQGRTRSTCKQYFFPDLPEATRSPRGRWRWWKGGACASRAIPRCGAAGLVEVGVERAHLEEDAGKSTHDPVSGCSFVDLNRAGVPLLEIVGAPHLRSGQEAYDYLKAVHRLVTFLGICDGNLEEGSMRCDANVSVHRPGDPLGTRVEVKNINSFRFVRQALDFEIGRQVALAEQGQEFPRKPGAGCFHRRDPQPAGQGGGHGRPVVLPGAGPACPVVAPAEIEAVRRTLPELPEARLTRFLFHSTGCPTRRPPPCSRARPSRTSSRLWRPPGTPGRPPNWMLGEVSRSLKERGQVIQDLGLGAAHLGELIDLVERGTITLTTAKETVYPALLAGEGGPGAVVARLGLGQVSDRDLIVALAQTVLAANPGQLAQYRAGKGNLRGFFVGQVMKAGQGRVNPQVVNQVLDQLLAVAEEA